MALPPELRLIIYEFTLIDDHPITMRLRRKIQDNEPSLLLTSKAVRHEARALYYKLNSFRLKLHLVDFRLAAKWLAAVCKQLGPRAFGQLRFVVQREPTWTPWTDMPNIFPLLQLHYSGTIRLQLDLVKGLPRKRVPLRTLFAAYRDNKSDPDSLYVMCPRSEHSISIPHTLARDRLCVQRALENLTSIVHRAKAPGWSDRRLREELWTVHLHNIMDLTREGRVRKDRLAKAEHQRRLGMYEA
ncbi:hypothetical protein LTR36_000880 [Oleoguttula mirabilis]|uniref:Uncharacterized protein n=1 Tax=Oleoguttula mirabilis TaxID=1507867 RepID=A0AAV9J308_9PEZI|nr:hypothetical protein LTR36_000880 [Oleoguttula mirabilis]